jgi:outer membrane protein OmpA-like peptidoglycan-associated protein
MKKLTSRIKVIGSICLASAVLTGCSTVNPYTGQTQTSNATTGTVIGGLGGAGVGALIGGGRGALIGGAFGALTGGLIGNAYDRENAELRNMLVGTGVQVDQHGRDIRLVMASDVTFYTGQYSINPSYFSVLDSVASVLRKYNDTSVIITGYTDNVGNPQFNLNLSQNRAQSVGSYLVSRGVSPERLYTQGRGMRHPIASNATAEGRSLNRRVVINLRPLNNQ